MDQSRLFLLGVNKAAHNVEGDFQGRPQLKGSVAQPAAQVGSFAFLPGNPLQSHKGLVVEDVHMKTADDVGVFLQLHPGGHLLLKDFSQGGGLIARLEGFEGVGLDCFQVKAEIHFAHPA
jgi:hypothetical protein